MTETLLNIKHWGNSLGVRLPAAVARAAGLRADQRVRVSVEGERVVIERVQETPLTLEQRLARFNPDRHRGEALVSERVGAERW
jgi:antitoxin MazE